MDLILATVVFPAVFLALTLGTGLLVERAAGWTTSWALLPVLGAAALIGVSQLTTIPSFTAPATPFVFVALAIAGFVLGRGRLRTLGATRGAALWPLAAMVAVYGIAIAAVLLSGRLTLTAYLLDTTSATHVAGADFMLHHGRDWGALNLNTSYGLQIDGYFSHAYPSGGHTLFAGAAWLIPVSLLWMFQPFMAAVLALTAGPAWLLLRRAGLSSPWAALGAICASVPALVFGLTLAGSIKEITALPLILATGALVVDHRRWLTRGWRAVIPGALVVAAGLSAIGTAFLAWAAVALIVLAVCAYQAVSSSRTTWRNLGLLAGAGVVLGIIAALPTIGDLTTSLRVANGIATTSDPGNLLQPLKTAQVLGIWLHGQYRTVPPAHVGLTYTLIGVALVAVVIGAGYLVRRSSWALVGWIGGLVVMWIVLTVKGTTWTDAKLILLMSPVIALLVWSGVWALVQSQRWFEGLALAALIVLGVAWSDGLQYHDTNLAPTKRFDELAAIGDRFAGKGPTTATDFDEYAFDSLRDTGISAPGFAFKPPWLVRAVDGSPTLYGNTYDTDQLAPDAFAHSQLIVQRRSPEFSRPPSNYRRVWHGRWYDVWQRSGPAPIAHLGLQSVDGRPTAVASCSALRGLARQARSAGGTLLAAEREPFEQIDPIRTGHSPGWPNVPGVGVGLSTPGRLDTEVTVPRSGRWQIWLKGDVARPLDVQIDGRSIGSAGWQSGGQGNYLAPLVTTMSAGKHRLSILRGGGSLRPSSGSPSRLVRIVVQPDGAASESHLVRVDPADVTSLCGRRLDWVEAVRS